MIFVHLCVSRTERSRNPKKVAFLIVGLTPALVSNVEDECQSQFHIKQECAITSK